MGIRRHSTTAGTLAVLAAVSLGVGACAQEAGTTFETVGRPAGFAATPEYLASAIDDSQALASRFEMTVDWEIMGRSLTPDEPIASGETDGERTHLLIEFGAVFETMADELGDEEDFDLPSELLGDDLTFETVGDASTLYIRGGFLAAIGDSGGHAQFDGLPAEDVEDLFGSLGDDWAKVDLTALEGLHASEIGPLTGNQNMDPRVFLEMVAGTDDVEDLGSDEIDGEPVTGLAAKVTVRDMIEAQGMDVDEVIAQSDMPDALAEDFLGFEYDVHLWIDDEANVRRLIVDMGAMLEQAADTMGEELPVGGFSFRMTMDFFDYGDESIVVEVPTDAVDITEDLAEVLEGLD